MAVVDNAVAEVEEDDDATVGGGGLRFFIARKSRRFSGCVKGDALDDAIVVVETKWRRSPLVQRRGKGNVRQKAMSFALFGARSSHNRNK